MVTSIDVDHSGSRLLAGSRDYSLRMFDFNGMKSDMRSFRRIEPSDGHPVHSVSLSPTGQHHLVIHMSTSFQSACIDFCTVLFAFWMRSCHESGMSMVLL